MAGGGFVSSNGGKEYPGNLTLYVTLTCIVAAMGGLIFGYDIGISGGVTSMDPFLSKFFPTVLRKKNDDTSTNQYCKFDSEKLTMFTSSLYLAALGSSLVASIVTRKMGRKLSMLFGGVLFLAGALLNGFAKKVWMLIVGRILLGFGIGFANQSVPLYLSEMAPYKYRGALNIGFQLSITIGILVANVLNYFFAKIDGGWGWRLSLGGAMVPALIISVGSIILPETPNSMIERGQNEEAKTKLIRIRGVANVDEEFNDLVAASEASRLVEHPWRNLLQRKYRPHLTMAVLIPFFQQLTGINVIMFYAPVLFQTIGFGSDASLMSAVITGVVNVVATGVSIYGVDKWGRRFLFLEGGVQMLICQIVVAICIGVKFGINGNPGELPKWYAIVQICSGKGYIDMSTVDADTSSKISEAITSKGGHFLEAPVSGSKKPAEEGQLVILAAGEKVLYEEAFPAFDVMGKKSFFLGHVGNGAKMKLVVNMIMGSMMNAFSEGLVLADKSGLNSQTLLDVLELGVIANPMFKMKGPTMIQNNYTPAFPLKHQQKDMRLALGLGDKNAVSMPIAAAANEAFKKARNLGLGDLDFSAVHQTLKGGEQ